MGIPELWEFPDLIVFKTLENPFPKSSVWESHTLLVGYMGLGLRFWGTRDRWRCPNHSTR